MYELKLITSPEEVRLLYEFIKSKPLDYPDYMLWVEKCMREIELGSKKAVVCAAGEEIIANIIFQQQRDDPLVLEIKNSRVIPEHRLKGVFAGMMKCAERYALEKGFSRMVCDCHENNIGVVSALEKIGFEVESREDLYNAGLEIIMSKAVD